MHLELHSTLQTEELGDSPVPAFAEVESFREGAGTHAQEGGPHRVAVPNGPTEQSLGRHARAARLSRGARDDGNARGCSAQLRPGFRSPHWQEIS